MYHVKQSTQIKFQLFQSFCTLGALDKSFFLNCQDNLAQISENQQEFHDYMVIWLIRAVTI